MINLIKNELDKIMHRKTVYVLIIALLLVFSIIAAFEAYDRKNISESEKNEQINYGKEELQSGYDLANYKLEKEKYERENNITEDNYKTSKLTNEQKNEYQSLLSKYYIAKYYKDNNINYNEESLKYNLNNEIKESISLIMLFIILLTVILSASSICDEFNSGTIKLLMIKPYKRYKILLSKIISIIIISVLVYIISVISETIIFGVVNGFNIKGLIEYNFNTCSIVKMSLLKNVIVYFLCALPELLILMIFSIMISVFALESIASIGSSIVLFIVASFTSYTLIASNSLILRLIPTNYWDLSEFVNGKIAAINGVNIYAAIASCTITFIILSIISFIRFNKMDIKNV